MQSNIEVMYLQGYTEVMYVQAMSAGMYRQRDEIGGETLETNQ